MELDPVLKAEEIAKKMEEEARKNGSNATFSVHTEKHGTKSGQTIIVKEKPDGEVVLYDIDQSGIK